MATNAAKAEQDWADAATFLIAAELAKADGDRAEERALRAMYRAAKRRYDRATAKR